MRNILFGLLIIFASIGTFPSLSLGQGGSGEGSSWYPGEGDKGWAGTYSTYDFRLGYYRATPIGYWQNPSLSNVGSNFI